MFTGDNRIFWTALTNLGLLLSIGFQLIFSINDLKFYCHIFALIRPIFIHTASRMNVLVKNPNYEGLTIQSFKDLSYPII